MTQARIAELFAVERSVVTKHLQNIFQEGELDKDSTCAKIAQVQTEGSRQVTRDVEFYNLDVIIEEITKQFFGTVQNKLHFAIMRETAQRFFEI